MLDRLIKILVVSCIAFFGLRGALPDVISSYSTTTVFLFALVVIPVASAVIYEVIARAVRSHKFKMHMTDDHAKMAKV
jgi:hypothetical protein